MSDETLEQELAVDTAPEQETTAAPDLDVSQPEDANDEAPKTFTQEELDAIVSKRLAREQRKWQREQEHQSVRPKADPSLVGKVISADNFETVEAYADALAEQKLAEQRILESRQTVVSAYRAREDDARDKYDDFQNVVYGPHAVFTDAMTGAILESDIGPEIAYYLGSKPNEARRIADMSPFAQAKEIGRLEASLAANPPAKRTSSAPPPIAPVTARSANTSYDTTDPRSLKTMTTEQWIEAERARQIKRLRG